MTQVQEAINVDATRPGRPSQPHWGHAVAARYQQPAEYLHPQVGSDYNYSVTLRKGRWTLQRTDEGYIASDTLTGIFGFGSDANQAARDLVAALHEHRDVLERQDALSPALQEQLTYLRELL
jgi:hypothetical protein